MNKFKDFIDYVENNYLGDIITNTSFKALTTLKIGGKIACYFEPLNLDTLVIAYKYIIENKLPYFIIGNGSNLLASDKNFLLIVISLKKLAKITQINKQLFLVEAGITDNKLSTTLAKMGYTKIEFLSVIPGTLGGAIYMNAGSYQEEIKDILKEVTYLTKEGKLVTKKQSELNFAYRYSDFQKMDVIIVSALIEVTKASIKEYPTEKILTLRKQKRTTQPINMASAGSTFKNNECYEAWKIVDQLGYRGFRVNDAMVSNNHTNYLVNIGNATFNDMINLIEQIKLAAKNNYNIDLKCEWEILN